MKNFKNKKLYVMIIVVLILIMIPISVYGYSSIEYKNSIGRARNLVEEEKYDEAISSFNEITKSYFGKKNIDEVNNYVNNVKKLKENKKVFDEALKLLNDRKYLEAIEGFKKIPKEDSKRYEVAGKKIEECKNLYISLNIENAKNEAKANNYDSAINFLALVLKLDDTNKDAISLKDEFIKAKEEVELKAKQEAEAKAKQEAEAKAKQEAEAKAKQEASEKAKKPAAVNIAKPQPAYAPTQVTGNEAIKNEFKKMGFVFQSDTIASYTKDGMNVTLEYVEDGGEKGSCWAISTSAFNYGYKEERLITNAMVVILGGDKASNNLTYIHYALGTSESFETPSIKTLIYNQKLYAFIYIPK